MASSKTDPRPSADVLDVASTLNGALDGHNVALGLRFVSATREAVVAELTVGPHHHQAYGIVHGGVYTSMVETACSVGAAMQAATRGASAVGLENHTSFLHAVREGILRVTATPVEVGRRTQLWQAHVTEGERIVASGRVRLYVFEGDAKLAGETLQVKDR
jgi:1,4-dihydroxy-2-naphthoyl-CoA hydrolase